MHWSLNKHDAFIFSLIGLCLSLAIAGGLIWLAPKVTEKKFVDNGDGVRFPLIFSQLGIRYRIWHSVDEDWPWKDKFPKDTEAVCGAWIGLPFTALHRRVEIPIYVAPPGSTDLYLHPDSWSPYALHNDLQLYRPHWIGLLADTLFWGSLAWLARCFWQIIIAHRTL